MSERKIVFRVLSVGFMILVAVFLLLFIYVDMKWRELRMLAINPMHTVIATGIMLLIGIGVYIVRNRKNKDC